MLPHSSNSAPESPLFLSRALARYRYGFAKMASKAAEIPVSGQEVRMRVSTCQEPWSVERAEPGPTGSWTPNIGGPTSPQNSSGNAIKEMIQRMDLRNLEVSVLPLSLSSGVPLRCRQRQVVTVAVQLVQVRFHGPQFL